MKKIEEVLTRKPTDFLFFWGHTNKESRINKTCLSQWYDSPFIVDNITFKTAEHYMMFKKAELFKNYDMFDDIIKSLHPSDVKKYGRIVKNFDSNIWDEEKYNIVVEGNKNKFSQNEYLKKYLLSTGDKVLVEASPYDKIWGIGMKSDNPNATKPLLWDGENLLGFALMDVRDYLK